jgi:hypothetical protein
MHSDTLAALAVSAVLAFSLAGCAVERTVLEDSAVDAYPGYEAELDFWDELATRSVVTNNDALYGLLLVSGEESPPAEYEGRLTAARARGWLGGEDAPPMNESAAVGLIAVAVCDILDIKGGLTMRVFGPSGRYCTRELVYREYIPRRTDNQSLSGLEFIDLLSRVEDEMRPPAEEEAGAET